MKLHQIIKAKSLFLTGLFLQMGCNDPALPPIPSPPPVVAPPISTLPNGLELPPITGDNVIPISVNGSQCSTNSYLNKPCITVKVCSPGTSTCQTISDILLDTGSYGLRVFKSVLTPEIQESLTPVTVNGNELAECVHYGDGSMDWGPIRTAGVILGNESAVKVNIQVIDSTFGKLPSNCQRPEPSPKAAGFNGILGVGIFPRDCGKSCATRESNKVYFACSDSECISTKVPIADQVQNPVSALPIDNNGILLRFSAVSDGGQDSSEGYMILGIGTRDNNIPTNPITFPVDPATGDITTHLNGETYTSFMDTGSNGLFFPTPTDSSLPDCGTLSAGLAGWFCPVNTVRLKGVNSSLSGNVSNVVPFQIGDLSSLIKSSHRVFSEVGGGTSGTVFDWGLPFYLGRNVYLGFEGAQSSLGTGPFWAY